jgi:hypothetical protein
MIKRYSSMFNCNQNYHKYKKNIKYDFKDLISKQITSLLNFTPFPWVSLIYNSEDKKNPSHSVSKNYLKIGIISQSKYEN